LIIIEIRIIPYITKHRARVRNIVKGIEILIIFLFLFVGASVTLILSIFKSANQSPDNMDSSISFINKPWLVDRRLLRFSK